MTGPKLNEKSYTVGERSGTKATAKYVRSSATKARAVLDLIRGLDVRAADEVLQFTDRHIARDVRKVLASAVSNAINNDDQEAEELFVLACFADEGPTLRRFRPRARGRATRINKRTCHITIIVARMSDERIAVIEARQERSGGSTRPRSSAASRRARVERSRQRSAEEQPTVDEIDDAHEELDDTDDEMVEEAAESSAETSDDEATTDEGSASDESDASRGGSEADDEGAPRGDATSTELEAAEWAGSIKPIDEDGKDVPEGYPIKGNADSMLYHTPDSRYYGVTKAEVWFDTVESAEAAGFSAPGTSTDEEEN